MLRALPLVTLAALSLGCRPPAPAVVVAVKPSTTPQPIAQSAPVAAAPHVGEAWYPLRAARLGLDLGAAKARDASFLAAPPADGLWWDADLAREVVAIWSELCSECHGGSRELGTILALPPPPRGWLWEKGPLFNGRRVPEAAFKSLQDGVRVAHGRDMPSFKDKLSNEQLWGLVYFIRAASSQPAQDLR
ncbi:MAG: cytochrome c [Myxococcota bacterium]